MKRNIKILTCLLSMTILFSSVSTNAFSDVNQSETIPRHNQTEAVENYKKLIESYKINGEIQYPDYYGGAYIDKDNFLNICVKSGKDIPYKNVLDHNSFKVKNVTYSYNELNDTMSLLNQYRTQKTEDPVFSNIPSYHLSQEENMIIVNMKNKDDTQITAFKEKIMDSPVIKFANIPEKQATQAKNEKPNVSLGEEHAPGTKTYTVGLRNHDKDLFGSVGYRAKRGEEIGFVTAGHISAFDKHIGDSQVLMYNKSPKRDEVFGIIDVKKVEGTVDAAFVKRYSIFNNVVNKITETETLSEELGIPVEGQKIQKQGAKTFRTEGKIISTNSSFHHTLSDKPITDTIYTDVPADGGDSGGIGFPCDPAPDGKYYNLGIVTGGEHFVSCYFIKSTNIKKELGLN